MKLVITKVDPITSKKGEKFEVAHYVNPKTGETGTIFHGEGKAPEAVAPEQLQKALASTPVVDVEFNARGRAYSVDGKLV